MKIAVAADGPDLDASVSQRFGETAYLLVIDMDSSEYEVIYHSATTKKRSGAGIQAVTLAMNKGAQAILTGYINPSIVDQLKSAGIEVQTGITGTVKDAIETYKNSSLGQLNQSVKQARNLSIGKSVFFNSLKSASRQFFNLLPILIGVILLIGLFNTFISEEILKSIFTGNVPLDTVLGAFLGSIFAGNPINSYIIGGELLTYDVSLFAVTAFIVTWVTVGLVQLPAEITAFGRRFALSRNGFSFLLALPVAVLTVVILKLVEG